MKEGPAVAGGYGDSFHKAKISGLRQNRFTVEETESTKLESALITPSRFAAVQQFKGSKFNVSRTFGPET
jgi:hypothetical protein